MSASSRNLRLADWLYGYLHVNGPKDVAQIKDYINNDHMTVPTGGVPATKVRGSYSSPQIAGVLQSSPLFQKAGFERVTYSSAHTPCGTVSDHVYLWEIVPVEEVVDKMLANKNKHRLRRFQPNVIKQELKRRGEVITNE